MKIGILGAGMVGQSLAQAVIAQGHDVMLSSREPNSERMQNTAQELGAQVGTVAETIAFGEIVAFALRWDAVNDVIAENADWSGKIVLDMMNRFGNDSPRSKAEDLAEALSGAHIVKALNTIGAEHYPDPHFAGQSATMFMTGDDSEAKSIISGLLTSFGFEVIDIGGLAETHHLESLAALWVHLAFRAGHGRNIAFKLLKG